MSATTSPGAVSSIVLDARADTVARLATVIAESTPLPEAWTRLHHDDDHCGLVVRDGMPIAVVTAGYLAERWPGGGPLDQHRWTVHDVLDQPCGVEVLSGNDTLRHAGQRLLAAGLPGLPVRSRDDELLRVVTATRLLAVLLAGGPRP